MRRTGTKFWMAAGVLAAMSLAAWGAPGHREEGVPAQTQPAAEGAPGEVRWNTPDGKPPWVAKAEATEKAPKAEPLVAADKVSTTQGEVHVARADGTVELVKYTATAGYLPLKDEAGKLRANIFFVAYTKDEAAAPAATEPASTGPAGVSSTPGAPPAAPSTRGRPIMFCFNGGPGAASAWLHLGAAGPQRVALNDDGTVPPPPYHLVENAYTWLGDADLVFVDPVNTGYSRAATPDIAKEFFGYREDIQAMGEFIRLYLTQYQRWDSPKFIAGESYGTTRAAGLSEYLHDHSGIALNGVIMISTVLNFQVLSPHEGNDLPYALYLPSYAAAAWYHKKLAPDLERDLNKTLAEVEAFASNEYTVALAKGAALSAADRRAVVDKLARYTSLSADYIERSNLRIDPSRFEKMLLLDGVGAGGGEAGGGRVIGRFDDRISGSTPDEAGDSAEYDPSLSYVLPVYTATFNDYVRRVLRYDNDLTYEVLSGRVQPWNLGSGGGPGGSGYLYVADNLANAMRKNPHLKVFVASGRFDLATPYFATQYTFDHMNLPEALRKNLEMNWYPGGHMLYHVKSNLEKLHGDIAAFVKGAVGP